MPVEAIAGDGFGAMGPEWQVEGLGLDGGTVVDGPAPLAGETTNGFGDMLADKLGGLQATQEEAAAQSQALAAGTAEDASQVVMAVERAQLSMQLAAQLRDRGTDAFQEIFRTQV
jgi:flagellar hook-basal body complex protein FliE